MSKDTLYHQAAMLNGMCGVGLINNVVDFNNLPKHYKEHVAYYKSRMEQKGSTLTAKGLMREMGFFPADEGFKHHGGAGFLTTGFIPTKICKELYDILCQEKQLIYQSPVRKNKNSGNDFFFAVFNDSPKTDDITQIASNWPWEDKDLK